MKRAILIVILAMMISGCASNGRLRFIHVDLRTPEQMVAGKDEACIVYTSATKPSVVPPVAPKGFFESFPFSILVDLVRIAKGELTILSLEWSSDK